MPASSPLRLPAVVLCAAIACTAEPNADIGEFTASSPGSTTDAGTVDATSTGSLDSSTSTADDAGDPSSGGVDEATGNQPVLDVGSDDTGGPIGCDPAAQDFIFLLDMDSGLHRFDPDTLDLTLLGVLACEGGEGGAMALTIDRNGMLWTMMADAEGYRKIFTVDPDTLECEGTDFVDPIDEGYVPFSLTFVADGVDAETETMFINVLLSAGLQPDAPSGVMRIPDLDTMATEFVGQLPIPNTPYYEIADLSGTGEGRMFALFASEPATVAEVDTLTAAFVWDDTLDFMTGSAWGFAQWAGRLWMFTGTAPTGHSEVRAYDPVDSSVELVSTDLGVRIVGAAVSTCAPYEPEG